MNTGPMPEICGNAGIYARPFDGKDLARAIEKALELTPQARKKLCRRAEKFSWLKAMKDHRKIFAAALNDN
jgi:glycosyltransferase involved in cell wall biosynthesis